MTPTPLEFARCFGELEIVDAELIDEQRMAFLVGSGSLQRLVTFDGSQPNGQRWRSAALDGVPATLGTSVASGEPVLVANAWRVQSFALSGERLRDDALIMDREDRGGCRGGLGRLKQVQGQTWACGARRTLGVRLGPGAWRWWTDSIPLGLDADGGGWPVGFVDVDGFADGDVYAVGDGELWCSKERPWKHLRQKVLKAPFSGVCCAADGQVYLGSLTGALFRGRDENWKALKGQNPLARFKDMIWFEDQLWCTGDFPQPGVWSVAGDRMVSSPLPRHAGGHDGLELGGNLSTRSGVMLLAGKRGAALLRNGQWERIFDQHELLARSRADGSLAHADAERKAVRMADAAPVGAPRVVLAVPSGARDASGVYAVGEALEEAALQQAIDTFNRAVRERNERWIDEPEDRALWVDAGLVNTSVGALLSEVLAVEQYLGKPLPPDLRAFYLRHGELRQDSRKPVENQCICIWSPAVLLKSLQTPQNHERMDSLGLIDMVRHCWGNEREELEPGVNFSDAQIDMLNQQYTVFGRYNRDEGFEASGYLFFDRAGRFGRIWFSQDDHYGRGDTDFFTHCENLLVASTARHGLVDLLNGVMGEMIESMQEGDD